MGLHSSVGGERELPMVRGVGLVEAVTRTRWKTERMVCDRLPGHVCECGCRSIQAHYERDNLVR